MAWRIHENVVRGEIDNREKGVVRGRVWLEGLPEPLVLDLSGNACPDLAGCLLSFTNPKPAVPVRDPSSFSLRQRGYIGDLTASRKVRVYDIPVHEAYLMSKRGETPPEHIANCLYLEWFSRANGRVVIESVDYTLEISAPAWRSSPEDEQQRGTNAAAGWELFMSGLDAAIEQQQRGAKEPDAKWNEHDYERFMKECDARNDKFGELLDKYGHSQEALARINQEMGWATEMSEEEAEEDQCDIDELNAACEEALTQPPPDPDPSREGVDWIRTKDGDIHHPLQHRCFEAACELRRRCRDLGLVELHDDDLDLFLFEFQTTGVKLAGALDSIAAGMLPLDPAFTVAYLKRALNHLHQAQAALEIVAGKPRSGSESEKLLPPDLAAEARRELFEIREGILRLMQEYREAS